MEAVRNAVVEGQPQQAGRSVLVEQAARLLGVSRRTIYYRIREGQLQTIRTRCGSRRVLVESLEHLVREKEKT